MCEGYCAHAHNTRDSCLLGLTCADVSERTHTCAGLGYVPRVPYKTSVTPHMPLVLFVTISRDSLPFSRLSLLCNRRSNRSPNLPAVCSWVASRAVNVQCANTRVFWILNYPYFFVSFLFCFGWFFVADFFHVSVNKLWQTEGPQEKSVPAWGIHHVAQSPQTKPCTFCKEK